MNKTPFIIIYVIITALYSYGQENNQYNNSLLEQIPHHIKLSWKTSPTNSQAISWRTRDFSPTSYIEFTIATASPFFEQSTQKRKATTDSLRSHDGLWYYHRINLEKLKPNTTYSYRVGNESLWSAWSEFKTASGQKEPFTFLYFGDVQRYIYSLGSRTLRQAVLAAPDAKFMLFAGDLIHRGGLNKENWNEFFPAGGWAFQNIPTIATPGNHEHKWDNSTTREITPLWQLNFSFPENGPSGQKGQTYFIDYNNIRVISLDSTVKLTQEQRKETYAWLEKVLKECNGDWIFVTFHHAMAGLARNRQPSIRFPEIKALLEKYKVAMVLTGHEHVYARGRMGADFPIYAVSVAGPYQNAIQFSDWIERAGTSMQLYQEIHVTENQLNYVSKTVLGEVYDSFSITKNKHGQMQFVEATNLPKESLIPTKNFEKRYDKKLVETYEADKNNYLKKIKN